MSMTPEELRALMAEPDDTATTMTTTAETPEERKARIIHDMAMMDAAFERWEWDLMLNVLPFPQQTAH
ncbi:hypothetical protein PUR29_09295 [Methylobacterium ajmalii]|uniref:Uncharacterized protein n=1 Tax=Methylobacterium ajmalii TaxID=2738439 RepID=A0ABU9ZS79_9HYPH